MVKVHLTSEKSTSSDFDKFLPGCAFSCGHHCYIHLPLWGYATSHDDGVDQNSIFERNCNWHSYGTHFASTIASLIIFYLAANSMTNNSLVRGALHVDAKFALKAKWGNMRLIQGVAPWDADLFSAIMGLQANVSGGHTVEISISYLKELAEKLDSMFVHKRAIISKLNDSDSTTAYEANVTSFSTDEVVLSAKEEGYYDCTIPYVLLAPMFGIIPEQHPSRFVIVSASSSLDFLIGHSRDLKAKNDKEGQATFNFANVRLRCDSSTCIYHNNFLDNLQQRQIGQL